MKKILLCAGGILLFMFVSYQAAMMLIKYWPDPDKQAEEKISAPIKVKHYPAGITPKELHPGETFIWDKYPDKQFKSTQKYYFVIKGTLPRTFDSASYLNDHSLDAVQLNRHPSHNNILVFAKTLDAKYFPEVEMIK